MIFSRINKIVDRINKIVDRINKIVDRFLLNLRRAIHSAILTFFLFIFLTFFIFMLLEFVTSTEKFNLVYLLYQGLHDLVILFSLLFYIGEHIVFFLTNTFFPGIVDFFIKIGILVFSIVYFFSYVIYQFFDHLSWVLIFNIWVPDPQDPKVWILILLFIRFILIPLIIFSESNKK